VSENTSKKVTEDSEESNHNKNSYKYWYNKGVEFSESNDYKKALIAYNQALVFGDKDPDIWNNKCYVLFKLGWYEEAINAGKIGVNLAPNDPVIWENLRNAYLANNNPEKAAECNNKISNSQTRSAEKKSASDNYRKPIDLIFILKICGGLFVVLLLFIIVNNSWQSIAKNTSSFLHMIVFLILLTGILYEGWKAVTQ
jgi:tetratricopeptide (TPR) repeat protein